jgi:hypothetical protein
MRTWTKILPYFFIEWYSKKYGYQYDMDERYIENYTRIVSPFKGVYIRVYPYEK